MEADGICIGGKILGLVGLKILLCIAMILSISPAAIAAEIVVDNVQHHLGDDFKDELVPNEPEGTVYTVDFNSGNPAYIKSASLNLDAKSIVPDAVDEFLDKVYLNEIKIAILNDYIPAQTSDNDLMRITFSLDPVYFKNGTNTIRITSGSNVDGTNYDDFEFSNLSIHLVETEPVTLEPPLKIAWTYELSDRNNRWEPEPIQIIEENIIYLNDEGIKAIDADSGKLLWNREWNANLNYDDGVLYAIYLPNIDAIDAKSGKLLWGKGYPVGGEVRAFNEPGEPSGYSAISGDTLYITTPSDKHVLAVDTTNGKLKWLYEFNLTGFEPDGRNSYSLSNPAIIDDLVIFKYHVSHFSYTGLPIALIPGEPEPEPDRPVPKEGLIALSAKTGEKIWEYTDEVSGRYVYNNLVYTRHLVYTGFNGGDIVALSADSGEEIWKIHVGDWISNIVAGRGKLFTNFNVEAENGVVDYGSIVVDAVSGEILADDSNSRVSSDSMATGKYLYAASRGKNNINIFDAKTGELVWAGGKTKGYDVSKPMVSKDKLYLTSMDGKLYAFEHGTGTFVIGSTHIYLATTSILLLIIGMVFYWKRNALKNIYNRSDFKNNLKFSVILAIIIHLPFMVFLPKEIPLIFSALFIGVIIVVGTIVGVISSIKTKNKFNIGFLIGVTPYLLLAFLMIYYLVVESKYGYADAPENYGGIAVMLLVMYTLAPALFGGVLGYVLGMFVLKENN